MLPILQPVKQQALHEIINDECLSVLRTLDSGRFDLIITSPPYNVGKEYEKRKSIEDYLSDQEELIDELVRTLSDRGNLCWQVGNYVHRGEVFPLDIYYYPIFKRHGLRLRNRVVWHFRHGLHASNRFSGRYETLLWFSKTDDYIFNLDNVRIPAKYPGKLHFKGPKRGQPSGNPLGKNPSDVWDILQQDWETGIWDFPNVKSNHPEKTGHPCQFPVELVERCVLALSNVGSWILDPFAGVCSTVIGSIAHDRNAVGIERDSDYCSIATKRVQDYLDGKLRLRPMTKPIHVPSPNDKIAQPPRQWIEQSKLFQTETQRNLFSRDENNAKVLASKR